MLFKYLLLMVVGLFALICEDQAKNYDAFQCEQPVMKSFQEVKKGILKHAYKTIYVENWMKRKVIFIDCTARSLQAVPQFLNASVNILWLYVNMISYIGEKDLKRYTSLEVLSLDKNCLHEDFKEVLPVCKRDMVIHPNAFRPLHSLKALMLQYNQLKILPGYMPPSLHALVLANCELKPVMSRQIALMANLTVLSISANCITGDIRNFCPGNFTIIGDLHLPKILYMDLSFNNWTSIPNNLFSPSLEVLEMNGNPVHVLKKNDFASTPALRKLELSETSKYDLMPMKIESGALESLVNLTSLVLSGNMLTHLPMGFLQKNKKIFYLDLRFNCFKATLLNLTMFPPLPLLRYLVISGNHYCKDNFTYGTYGELILGKIYTELKHLRALDLGPSDPARFRDKNYAMRYQNVTLRSLQALKSLPRVTNVVFAACGIKSVNMAVFSGWKSQYFSIDLSYNDIRKIYNNVSGPRTSSNPSVARHYPNHHLINLKVNAITFLHPDTFQRLGTVDVLDLSFNQITYIASGLFKSLELKVLNLGNNRLRRISENAFGGSISPLSIHIFQTVYYPEMNLDFLHDVNHSVELNVGGKKNGFFYLLIKNNATVNSFSNVVSLNVSDEFIPFFEISKNYNLFKSMPNLKQITFRSANIRFPFNSEIFKGVPNVTKVEIFNSYLEWFPYKALQKLTNLTLLRIETNALSSLNRSLVWCCSKLVTLSLKRNKISYIQEGTFDIENLKYLDLSFNPLHNFSPKIFTQSLFAQLETLDLRFVVLTCDCSMSDNFGWLVRSGRLVQKHFIGFLPFCPATMFAYHGGCLACYTKDKRLVSIFSFSLSYSCQSNTALLYMFSFTIFNLFFLFVSILLYSKWFHRWLIIFVHKGMRRAQRTERGNKTHDAETLTDPLFSNHAFVFYDSSNPEVGDWVDLHLAPKMESGNPPLLVGVVKRDDFCGPPPLQQLLLRMQCSRKTILILSRNFVHSPKCRYVISVLEDWTYSGGQDRCVIINFEQSLRSCPFVRYRSKKHPHSVLDLQKEPDNGFWEEIRTAILV